MTFQTHPSAAPTTAAATPTPLPAPGHTAVGGEVLAPYPVVVGTGLHEQVGALLGEQVQRTALVHPPKLATAAHRIAGDLERHGRYVLPLVVPAGEGAKDAGVLVYLWSQLAEAGFTRFDAVVALGGGATADLAGFLAATWQGGIPLILAPSTTAAMTDAAVAGPVALNIPQGKNLAALTHRPAGVVCDLDLLATLPRADHVSGLAEVVKAGLLADPALLDLIEADPRAVSDPAGEHTRELIERTIRAKAALATAATENHAHAGADGPAGQEERHGQDGREFLGYGHLLAHAVEHAEGYRIRHGHALSIGMVYAAELAHQAGRLDAEHVQRHRTVLEALHLPTGYPRHAWERLRAAFAPHAAHRGRLRCAVLDAPGRPGLLCDPAPELLHAAYTRLAT
ncbi:3-dehydroquinate synthase family protein [Streptomyces sp. NPDC005574]|uniref:3-dehydroquinate synthase family protein n=1 Tax=Streptomyces sp. NPDC005574 TaxID=3156891 RepID=UPI00339E2CCF